MSTPREELRDLVERLPDEQVQAVVSDLKARLTAVERERPWPPAWFAVAEGSALLAREAGVRAEAASSDRWPTAT